MRVIVHVAEKPLSFVCLVVKDLESGERNIRATVLFNIVTDEVDQELDFQGTVIQCSISEEVALQMSYSAVIARFTESLGFDPTATEAVMQ